MLTLGIDSSTQGTKAVVYDTEARRVVASAAVNYGRDLPAFGMPDGFLPNPDTRIRRADPRLWIAGLDLVLARLRDSGAPMGEIAAIGGDAQQHATVYLTAKGVDALKTCALGAVDATFFSRAESPIWMDSSTGAEVAALDAQFGAALQTRTGSPAIERFAAAQVMKFAKEDPAGWARTARVHLLSSFLTSYLAGADAPIETGDGAGMNLLNLQTLAWDADICAFAAPGLAAKLPAVYRPKAACALKLAPRFAVFGLKPGIPVAPFTGDNPASLVGCGAEEPGRAVISLGTSDVFFGAMRDFKTDPDGFGHVFGNPMGGFMSLSCFKNGSLARERVKKECGVDWTFFDETAFDLTPAGNNGQRAFPYFETEITPKHAATGIEANFNWQTATNETKIRAIVEGQMGNMFERTRWIGDFDRISVTGGASKSRGIRGVIANLFKAKVETLEVADSAAVGGARLAKTVLGALVAVGLAWTASAAWQPAGELQVASMDALNPQVNTLAAVAKFPLLPLLVQSVVGEGDLTKKFGMPRTDADFGVKFFVDGDEGAVVWAWPLAKGGVAAWQTAHPKRKIENGVVTYKHKADAETGHDKPWKEFAAFSKDGAWVFCSENEELVRQAAAAKEAPFAKPLKKGFASMTFTEPFFKGAKKNAGELRKSLAEANEALGDENATASRFIGPALEPFMKAFLGELVQARFVLGVSDNGLDLRAKVTPRAGGSLAGATRTLPVEALAFKDVPGQAEFVLAGPNVNAADPLGKAWLALWQEMQAAVKKEAAAVKNKDEAPRIDEIARKGYTYVVAGAAPNLAKKGTIDFATAVPEYKQTQTPVFVARGLAQLGAADDKGLSLTLWLFGWRDKGDYRLMVRLTKADLAKAFAGMVQMGTDAE